MVPEDKIDLDMGFIMMPEAIPGAQPPEPPGPGREPPTKTFGLGICGRKCAILPACSRDS